MKTILATAALVALSASTLAAQQAGGSAVEVAQAVVATGIEDREPVGVAETFPATVEQVFFFTELRGDFGERQVEHVWLREGEEMARVPLTVRGPRWRTWSSKRIPPDWAGAWTAQVVDAGGAVLTEVDFVVGGVQAAGR